MATKEGFMQKKGGGLLGGYQSRFFVLDGTLLTYYKDGSKKEQAGQLDIKGAKVEADPKNKSLLVLSGGALKKKYELKVDGDDDRKRWSFAIEGATGQRPPSSTDGVSAPPPADDAKPAAAPAAAKPAEKPAEKKAEDSSAAASAAPAAAASAGGDGGAGGAKDRVERKEVKPGSNVFVTKSQLPDGGLDFTVENLSPDSVLMKINLSATKHMDFKVHEQTRLEDGCAVAFTDPQETMHMVTMYKIPGKEGYSARVGYQFTKDDPSDRFLGRERDRYANRVEDEIKKIKAVCTAEDLKDMEAVAEKCKKHGLKFVDLEFPPTAFNLPQFIWQRPCDFLDKEKDGEPVLFDDCIEPNDIFQGSLGDCWYMCALATMAEFPDVVRKCLPERENDDPTGCHRMRICKDGWWRVVVLDDYFPCNFGRGPAYAKNKGAEMWSALMEKAYAKVHGSFASMCTGLTGQALAELTGFPYKKFSIRTKNLDTEKLWQDMRAWDAADYMMAAGTPGDGAQEFGNENEQDGQPTMSEEEYRLAGFITSHSYSVIDCKETHGHRLMKIRNPWGGLEWNGDWSDDSPLWTDEIRDFLGFEAADDGLFWMSFQDFLKYFVNVTVCYNHMHSVWRDIRAQAWFNKAEPEWYMEVYMNKPSKCFISISQKDKRSKARDDPEYEYYEVGLIVLKPTGKGYSVHEWTGFLRSRDVWVLSELEANDRPYIIIPWTCYEGKRLFNLSFIAEASDFGRVEFHKYDPQIVDAACTAGTLSRGENKIWNTEHDCGIYTYNAGRMLGVLAVNNSKTANWTIRMTLKSPNWKYVSEGQLRNESVLEITVPRNSLRYIGTFTNVTGNYSFEYSLQQQLINAEEGEGNEGMDVNWAFSTPMVKATVQLDGDKKDHQEILHVEKIECNTEL